MMRAIAGAVLFCQWKCCIGNISHGTFVKLQTLQQVSRAPEGRDKGTGLGSWGGGYNTLWWKQSSTVSDISYPITWQNEFFSLCKTCWMFLCMWLADSSNARWMQFPLASTDWCSIEDVTGNNCQSEKNNPGKGEWCATDQEMDLWVSMSPLATWMSLKKE